MVPGDGALGAPEQALADVRGWIKIMGGVFLGLLTPVRETDTQVYVHLGAIKLAQERAGLKESGSLHARGWTVVDLYVLSAVNGFPACAGMDRGAGLRLRG